MVHKMHPQHEMVWQALQASIMHGRLSQSLLLLGQEELVMPFVKELIALNLCSQKGTTPCLECNSCLMLSEGSHPDVTWIEKEKSATQLKIEQIRLLQTEVYQTPKCGFSRFIVIQSAESMNQAAANALLKILEEPGEACHFILQANTLATLPPTILSRCQTWRFNPPQAHEILTFCPEPKRHIIDAILPDLLTLLKGEITPSRVATLWKAHEFSEILWALYVITSQLLIRLTAPTKAASHLLLDAMQQYVNIPQLFKELDVIYTFQKKLSHTVNVNPLLATEMLLMEFIGECEYV